MNDYEKHILKQIILNNTADQPHHPLRRFADVFLSERDNYQTYVPEWVNSCYHLNEGHFAMIDPDGEVYLSTAVDGRNNRSIGNINKSNWSDIWGGPKHLRQIAIATWEYRERTCANKNGLCRHNGANVALYRYNQLPETEKERFYPDYYLEDDGPFI